VTAKVTATATHFLNSDADTLRASGEAYGKALAAAGVNVRVETEPGSTHGHLAEPSAVEGLRTLGRFLERLTRIDQNQTA